MAAVLGTNVASLWASKNLQSAQSNMANSVERLSSGLRINRAKDDAAGLGISNALTQQINGANQGIRNLNDGISVLQTAEGAISAASEMAQRIMVLATQGANGTMGVTDRTTIQNELKQLLSSINSITARTKFGGSDPLLSAEPGTSGTKMTIVSSNASGDNVALLNTAFQDIGTKFQTVSSANTTSGAVVTLSSAPSVTLSQGDYVYKLSNGVYSAGVQVSSVSSNVITFTASSAITYGLNDVFVFSKGLLGKDNVSTGSTYSLLESVYSTDLVSDTTGTAVTGFQNLQAAASAYITTLDTQRGELGAMQNQLSYAVNNVTELSGNLSAARSRVMDTDYASETATLTKGQILQQAATAMLAQANQMPNVILTLLK
jgi:flagellin